MITRGKLFLVFSFLVFTQKSIAQKNPVVEFERDNFTIQDSLQLLNEYGLHKKFIPQFTLQTLIALSYFPELRHIHIRFKYKTAHSPLATRPTFPGLLFKKSKRRFTITISDHTVDKLEPILLKQMDFNAQIGVIGHELSHVADFTRRNILSLAGSGIGHIFSSHYIDRFEFRTDSICIAHGLGYQLLAWSTFVRSAMHLENWDGPDNLNITTMPRERYMNPSTIKKRIAEDSIYSNRILFHPM